MTIQRVFASVFTDHLHESRSFWVDLMGFAVTFDSNWFVHLAAPGDAGLELGLVKRDHETIPAAYRGAPSGSLITVVVDDVDVFHDRAVFMGVPILEAPTDMFYGQRRMLVTDPNGQLVDVSSPLDLVTTQVDV